MLRIILLCILGFSSYLSSMNVGENIDSVSLPEEVVEAASSLAKGVIDEKQFATILANHSENPATLDLLKELAQQMLDK